jgi:hypothetical protein
MHLARNIIAVVVSSALHSKLLHTKCQEGEKPPAHVEFLTKNEQEQWLSLGTTTSIIFNEEHQ